MNTYFIRTRVTPLPDNPLATKIDEAQVLFWIVEESSEIAMDRAARYLVSYRWKQESVDVGPVETTAADFADQEEGLKGFWKAKQKGFAAQFVARPKPPGAVPKEP